MIVMRGSAGRLPRAQTESWLQNDRAMVWMRGIQHASDKATVADGNALLRVGVFGNVDTLQRGQTRAGGCAAAQPPPFPLLQCETSGWETVLPLLGAANLTDSHAALGRRFFFVFVAQLRLCKLRDRPALLAEATAATAC